MLYNLIQANFATVVAVGFLLVFMRTNILLNKEITRKLSISLAMLVVLLVVDSVELWAASLSYPTKIRVCMSIIGYVIRPLIVYVIILSVYPQGKRRTLLMAVPAMINTVIMCTALFSDIAFSYDGANEFVRGPLGISAHVSSFFYLCLVLILSIHGFRNRNYEEAIVVFAILFICAVATYLESVWKHVGLLKTAIALSITFYYLYLYTQFFKKDALTGVLNRQCFYFQAEKQAKSLSAIIAIDLNDLKTINDTKGHEEGDKALCAVVNCIQTRLLKGCCLYRVGGDEFTILCNNCDFESVQKMVENITKALQKSGYQCAFGVVAYDVKKNFEQLCAEADQLMYENKRKLKTMKKEKH